MPALRPARTVRRTPTRRRCSSCRRTSRAARRSPSRPGSHRRSGRCWRPRLRNGRRSSRRSSPGPSEKVLDRAALGLAAPEEATTGVYLLRASARRRRRDDRAAGERRDLRLRDRGAAPARERRHRPPGLLRGQRRAVRPAAAASGGARSFPRSTPARPSGITGFTLPTLYRWVRSDAGREATLHPYREGHYLGSGQGEVVLAEAGLDGASQFAAIRAVSRPTAVPRQSGGRPRPATADAGAATKGDSRWRGPRSGRLSRMAHVPTFAVVGVSQRRQVHPRSTASAARASPWSTRRRA